MGRAIFKESEGGEQNDRENQAEHDYGVAPTGDTGVDQPVDQTHQSARKHHEAGPVRLRGIGGQRFVHFPPGNRDRHDADGKVNQEDASPTDLAGNYATENWAERRRNAGDSPPNPESNTALFALEALGK